MKNTQTKPKAGFIETVNQVSSRAMKLSFRLPVFVFLTIFLLSCNSVTPSPLILPTFISSPAPSSKNAVLLELNNQKVLLEFIQNNTSVPCTMDQNLRKVSLKPEPFTLMVYGNKEIVSIMALKSPETALPLQQSSKPLVAPDATGVAFYENDLYLPDEPLQLDSDSLALLQKAFSSSEVAIAATNFLKSQHGVEPLILTSTRIYLDLRRADVLNYTIKTINGNAIASGESIVLLVFIEKSLGTSPEVLNWLELKWIMFTINFE